MAWKFVVVVLACGLGLFGAFRLLAVVLAPLLSGGQIANDTGTFLLVNGGPVVVLGGASGYLGARAWARAIARPLNRAQRAAAGASTAVVFITLSLADSAMKDSAIFPQRTGAVFLVAWALINFFPIVPAAVGGLLARSHATGTRGHGHAGS